MSASSAERSTVVSRERIHRSRSGRSASAGSADDGAQPKFAYCANIPL
jgi:hypothetical protein